MKTEERQQEFLDRYDKIIESGNQEQMERLGAMVKRTMRWLIANEPEIADKALAMLDGEGVEAKNHLTRDEAEAIVRSMEPQPTWTLRQLEDALKIMKLPMSEVPYYDKNALLVTMMMIQSDSGETLKRLMHLGDKDERLITSIYQLALDRLKDKDGVFDIRKYFGI